MNQEVWIALGGNLGEREVALARAVSLLRRRGLRVLRTSHLYETAPEGGAPEPPYLNAVLQGTTELLPLELLARMRATEAELGRPAENRAGPRTCDLDLLSYGGLVLEEHAEERSGLPALRLPHPRLHRRSFVLVPLCELDVHWIHPELGVSAGELLASLPSDPGCVRLYAPFPIEAESGAARAGAC
jgi:2-amino-4-hydroxy-6-hydroxymethyldihydropteridine diphosphokinase